MPSPANPLERLLQELMVHRDLSADDQRAVLDLPVRVRTLDAHSYLVREGSVPTQCSVLIDGFGLIAFASIFPIVTVMSYAILMERVAHWREKRP